MRAVGGEAQLIDDDLLEIRRQRALNPKSIDRQLTKPRRGSSMTPACVSTSNTIGSSSPAVEMAPRALPLNGSRMPESGRSGEVGELRWIRSSNATSMLIQS